MARVCTFRWCDDLDGHDAAETVEFAIDRRRYSIDLSSENAVRLRAVLAGYLAAARVVGPPVGNRAAAILSTSRAPETPRAPCPHSCGSSEPAGAGTCGMIDVDDDYGGGAGAVMGLSLTPDAGHVT
ncbi:Lsr2 family protein [Pseudonocardia sp. EV170527-09]|uniref:Lsr2 dimerization domain-containing protein n=1 Tax=Pseudonocardia sp. EV170527-09 TaxID=2603411 RepID=UPI0011F3C6EB|nr:histone-like nucleoid-structuring protein Lsr2 [Pseudonocardia sp. EV170527-09]KAA1014618.1 Lsr2 family protein [Pseudonocardia sp. EV170527-09]